jgi:hypothetical protein
MFIIGPIVAAPQAVGAVIIWCLFGLAFVMMGFGYLVGSAVLCNLYVRAGHTGISFRVPGFFFFPVWQGDISWNQVESCNPYVDSSILLGGVSRGLLVHTHKGKSLFVRTMGFCEDPQTIADNIKRARWCGSGRILIGDMVSSKLSRREQKEILVKLAVCLVIAVVITVLIISLTGSWPTGR